VRGNTENAQQQSQRQTQHRLVATAINRSRLCRSGCRQNAEHAANEITIKQAQAEQGLENIDGAVCAKIDQLLTSTNGWYNGPSLA
jgi:hypothetical protein